MAYNVSRDIQLFGYKNIDATQVNSTVNILTIPSNLKFYPSLFIVELASVNELISVPSVSLGASSSYNNLLLATPLTSMTNVNNTLGFNFTAITSSIAAGSILGIKITTAAVGTAGLIYTVNCIIEGTFF